MYERLYNTYKLYKSTKCSE